MSDGELERQLAGQLSGGPHTYTLGQHQHVALLVHRHVAVLHTDRHLVNDVTRALFYLTQVALLSKHSPQELVVHSAESWLIEEVPGEGVLLVVYHLLVHCSLPLDSPRG